MASRLTFKNPDGRWGIVGMNEQNESEKMYGVAAKLRDYEELVDSPDKVQQLLYAQDELKELVWSLLKDKPDDVYGRNVVYDALIKCIVEV